MRWPVAIIALALAHAPVVAAALPTDVGVLTCTLAEGGEKDTNPDSQSRLIHCAFRPTGGPEEIYVGEIKKVGSQTALTGTRVLIWMVMGPPDRKLKAAVLQQTYVGREAPDATDKAKPRKVLVGELDNAYSLAPISDDVTEPASDTVTLIELRIKSSPG